MQVTKSFSYFFLVGICEIGGGYLLWLWLRGVSRPISLRLRYAVDDGRFRHGRIAARHR